MKIGVFHGRKYYLRNFATVLPALADRGHRLLLTSPESKTADVRVPTFLSKSPGVTTALYPNRRDDGLEQSLRLLRALRDAARYESPPLCDAYANRRRAHRKLLRAVAAGAAPAPEVPALGLTGEHAAVDATLAAVQDALPANKRLVRFIREQELELAIVISRVNFGGADSDVVKAARAAGIPSGLVVYSWDNLSSKGLIHEHPDRLFVWNEIQAREAVELHGLDPGRVTAVGAPRFDEFFALRPSAGRAELLGALGLDPERPTVLYLGSSGFVSKREPEFVDRWLAALRAGGDARLAGANVLVRPHPGALDEPAWATWRPRGERVAMPEIRKRPQDLYDQLSVADAVVALNTSAEIEAAIADRPVLTVELGDLAPGQEGSAHFRYLLAGEGGFVETAADLDEHLRRLARALADDPHAAARRRFLETFVRPLGVDRPAGPALADAIEALGNPKDFPMPELDVER